MSMPPTKTIIWAVDVFAEPDVQSRMLEALRLWTKGLPFSIQPTYVFGPHLYWPAVKEEGAVDRDLMARFSRFGMGMSQPLAALKVLRAKDSTLRERANALLEHAAAEKADAIALTTRAKKGLSRWAFGSLTETLTLSSSLPLLTLNPEAPRLDRLDSVLFPTDLSAESDQALMKVIDESIRRDLKLTIAYYSQFDQSHSAAAYGPASGYDDAQAGYLRKKRDQLSQKVKIAETRGLKAEGILVEGKLDVAEAILETAAERGADLIAMVSHCGPIVAAMGGSVTRRVVRAALCPVLVFHLV